MKKDFAKPVKFCGDAEARRSTRARRDGFPASVGRRTGIRLRHSLSRGGAPWRVIGIQAVLIVGIVIFFTFYLPHRTRVMAQRAVFNRELKINDFFRNAVKDDLEHEVSVPVNGEIEKRHPQVLTTSLSPQDVQLQLGAAGISTTDFRGGEHLTWVGTAHKLVASFNDGKLYCLTLEDRTAGHGVMVYQTPDAWHPY